MEPSQVKASKISEYAHEVVKFLENKGIKHSEMMAIGMGVSKIAESIIHTQTFIGVATQHIANIFNGNNE